MMALVPSRQFYPTTTTIFFDSFQSSFSRFNGTHLRLFRYGSSNSFKKHNLHTTQMALFSHILENQQNKSNFVFRNRPISQCNHKLNLCSSSSSSGNWMDKWNEPQKQKLPKQPRAALNYRNSENVSSSNYGNGDNGGGGGGGSSTMEKIVEKLKKFGYIDDVNKQEKVERVIEKGSVEDIFYVEEGMLPNARGGFSKESPLGVEDVFRGGDGEVRFPWEKTAAKEAEERDLEKKKSRSSMAELTIPEPELRRLRNLAVRTKHKTKVGGGGVTQAVVEMIHEKWKAAEIVRLKIEGPPALNMRRMHEILERKTGGLVIWRSGTSLSLYRGVSYEDPSVQLYKKRFNEREFPESSFSTPIDKTGRDPSRVISNKDVHAPYANLESTAEDKEDAEPLVEVKYENEVDKLLDGLGPRYTDWPGCDPLPVDADLLPGIVPGYQPPFRILPYGLRATLGQKEATNLRRLARVLPPHFALGRSRQLQGLAVAMIKLWERSSIAKITLKRGVQLTTSERMTEDIKKLTGGVLLSRNKDFLVFYRGKNFLSPDVTEALLERERLAKSMQDEEELARLRASALFTPSVEVTEQSGIAGTLSETLDADARWAMKLDNRGKEKLMREAEVVRHANLVRKLEKKLSFAERKLMKAERTLSKVEVFLRPTEPSADPESITDEERFMLRKLGLRMKAFLLLGRRGVFDGTVENMHLHWKYRELVKIMVKAKTFDQVKKVAISLEAESGGLLVSVDKVSKGYAIVVFRGKDYQRPSYLRPKNLLTKRKALARSIELQRREALNGHISAMQKRVEKLRSEIERMDFVKGHGDEELYDKFDSAYSTDDEDTDTEDEGDEAYLETFECENDGEVENDDTINNLLPETDLPYDIENLDLETESEVPESNAHGAVSASSIRTDDIKKEGISLHERR